MSRAGGQLVSTPIERLTAAVRAHLETAELVNQAAQGVISTLDYPDAIGILRTLRKIIEDHTGPVDASLVRQIYIRSPHGDLEVDGIGVVSIYRTKERKQWEHSTWQADVRGAVIERHANGCTELYDLDGNAIDVPALLRAVQQVHGSQDPRTTDLRALGLDPRDYCDEKPGRVTVTFKS